MKPRRRFKDRELRRRRYRGMAFLCGHVISGIVFLVWLGRSLDLAHWYVTVPFLVAEAIALGATTVYAMTIRHPRMHRPAGPRGPALVEALDVWICTAGEDLAVLEPTLASAMRIEYSRKRVFVLDDRASPALAALAARYGAHYIARVGNDDAKAGNLNHALRVTTDGAAPLILALDADQVPDADLVKRVGAYFRFPRVAFVQTEQRFGARNGRSIRCEYSSGTTPSRTAA